MTEGTVQTVLNAAAARLKSAGIEQPWREARLLLAAASDVPVATLMAWPEWAVAPEHIALLSTWIARRESAEPLARILGRREFWSLPFIVTPATLDPRADSETIIESALGVLPDRSRALKILDLGTGTGCLLLALLSEYPQAWGLGIDRSTEAVRVARANAVALGLNDRAGFVVGDWDTSLDAKFDLIVSNPPYIPTGEISGLMPDVRLFDPHQALDGGPDGLAPYRVLSRAAPRLLHDDGIMIVEIGAGQAHDVCALFDAAGLRRIAVRPDLAGIDRVVIVKWLGIAGK